MVLLYTDLECTKFASTLDQVHVNPEKGVRRKPPHTATAKLSHGPRNSLLRVCVGFFSLWLAHPQHNFSLPSVYLAISLDPWMCRGDVCLAFTLHVLYSTPWMHGGSCHSHAPHRLLILVHTEAGVGPRNLSRKQSVHPIWLRRFFFLNNDGIDLRLLAFPTWGDTRRGSIQEDSSAHLGCCAAIIDDV